MRWGVPARTVRQSERDRLLHPLFLLSRASIYCMMLTHTGEGHILYCAPDSNANLIQNRPPEDTPRNNGCGTSWPHLAVITLTITPFVGPFGQVTHTSLVCHRTHSLGAAEATRIMHTPRFQVAEAQSRRPGKSFLVSFFSVWLWS